MSCHKCKHDMASYAQHALGTSTQSAAVALAGGEGKGKSGAKRVPVLEPVTFRPDAAAAARSAHDRHGREREKLRNMQPLNPFLDGRGERVRKHTTFKASLLLGSVEVEPFTTRPLPVLPARCSRRQSPPARGSESVPRHSASFGFGDDDVIMDSDGGELLLQSIIEASDLLSLEVASSMMRDAPGVLASTAFCSASAFKDSTGGTGAWGGNGKKRGRMQPADGKGRLGFFEEWTLRDRESFDQGRAAGADIDTENSGSKSNRSSSLLQNGHHRYGARLLQSPSSRLLNSHGACTTRSLNSLLSPSVDEVHLPPSHVDSKISRGRTPAAGFDVLVVQPTGMKPDAVMQLASGRLKGGTSLCNGGGGPMTRPPQPCARHSNIPTKGSRAKAAASTARALLGTLEIDPEALGAVHESGYGREAGGGDRIGKFQAGTMAAHKEDRDELWVSPSPRELPSLLDDDEGEEQTVGGC